MTFFSGRQVYLAAILCCAACGWTVAEGPSDNAQLKGLTALTGAAFEPNLGQVDGSVDFVARGRGYAVQLRAGEATLSLQSDAGAARTLGVSFVGASPRAKAEPGTTLKSTSGYYFGNDPSRWVENVPHHANVTYRGIYDGIDATYYSREGHLEYDVIVQPGADVGVIRVAFTGADAMNIDDAGMLHLTVGGADVFQHLPEIYQVVDGAKRAVRGHYVPLGTFEAGFEIEAYDKTLPLVIDPVLYYSAYIGGTGFEVVNDVALYDAGTSNPMQVFLTGETQSSDFPDTSGGVLNGGKDAFIMKFNLENDGTQSLVNALYFGGTGDDSAKCLMAYASTELNVAVGGSTNSPGAFAQGTLNTTGSGSQTDGFLKLFRFNTFSGTVAVDTSRYLGGSGNDVINDLYASSSQTLCTGFTQSSDFPLNLTSAYDTTFSGTQDAFITRLPYNFGSLTYSSFIGVNNGSGEGLALSGTNLVGIVGKVVDNSMVVKNAFQTVNGGGTDAFAALFDLSLSGPTSGKYITYLGGIGDDSANACVFDTTSNLVITGETKSSNFAATAPTVRGTFNTSGAYDAYLVKLLNPTFGPATSLIYRLFLGGEGDDLANDIKRSTVNTSKYFITGGTTSTSPSFLSAVPVDAVAPLYGRLNQDDADPAFSDAFVMSVVEVNASDPSTGPSYATYLGGASNETAYALGVDAGDRPYVVGSTESTNFPTARGLSKVLKGSHDGFLTLITDIIYVDQTATGLEDGSTWANATNDLGVALGAAYFGDQIWVRGGQLFPNNDEFPNPGIELYGSLPANATSNTAVDFYNTPTVLSTTGDRYLNLDRNSRVSGIDFVGGTSTDGGAIEVIGAGTTTISECAFESNVAGGSGGAIYMNVPSGNLKIDRCVFQGNEAQGLVTAAGAIHVAGATSTTITSSVFLLNTGTSVGGILIGGGEAKISNCTFLKNAGGLVGARDIQQSISISPITVANCILWEGSGALVPLPFVGLNFSVYNSIVEGGLTGGTVFSILNLDPLLELSPSVPVDLSQITLLRPGTGSAAINNGIDASVSTYGSVNTDLEGNGFAPLPSCTFDIGAFANPSPVAVPNITLLGGNPLTVEAGTTFTDPGFIALDGCDGDITGSVVTGGTVNTSVVGTNLLTYDVTDAALQLGNAVRTVNVQDTLPPVITLLGSPTVTVECGGTYNDDGATALDLLDGDLTSSIAITGTVDTSVPGDYTLSYDVTDLTLNAATTVQRVVTVADTLAPVISIAGGLTQVVVECADSFVPPSATALDACSGDVSGSVSVDTSGLDLTVPGNYTIEYSALDGVGLSGIKTLDVVVQDTTLPLISLLGSTTVTVECGGVFTDAGSIASDACDGDLSGAVVRTGLVDTTTPGTYPLTYTVTDSQGLEKQVQRTVEVVDSVLPVLTRLGAATISLNCGDSFTDPGVTANDSCEGDLISKVITTGTVDISTPGDYTISYDVADTTGNAALTVTRLVQVIDNVLPVLTRLGAATVSVGCGSTFTDPGVSANDACDGDLLAQVVTSGTVDTTTPGDYTLTYDVSDISGNAAVTVNRLVQVVDTLVPVLSLIGSPSLSIECGATYNDAGATALDTCDGDLTGSIVVTNLVDTTTPGAYQVHYDVTDATGLLATQLVRNVLVQDTVAPLVSRIGAATVSLQCGDPYIELGTTVTDSCDPGLVATDDAATAVDASTPGTYTVTYSATDAEGNTGTRTRTVQVADNLNPVLTLLGSSTVTLACGDSYTDAGVTALDACDGDLTAVVESFGLVDTTTPGDYDISYSVEDASGNIGTLGPRTVTVVDNLAPTLSLIGANPLVISCGGVFTDPGATALDSCAGDITGSIVASGVVDTTTPGSYTRNYNVTDASGNAATVLSRTVNVVDTLAPALTLLGSASVSVECGTTYVDAGATANDQCEGDLTPLISLTGAVDTTTPGVYTLDYLVSDSGGLTAQKSRQVTVADTTDPVITLLGSATVQVTCGNTYTDAGATASDSCGGDLSGVVLVASTVDLTAAGSYTVTYNVDDASGNAASQVTRTVDVVDNLAPVVTLLGSASVSLSCGDTFTDPGATAIDTCSGNLTSEISVVGNVDTTTAGVYTLTYKANDAEGLLGQATRQVTVLDTLAPVVTLLGSATQTVACGANFVDAGATALDACEGDLTGVLSISGVVDTTTPGDYTITYKATDGQALSGSASRVVTVVDTVAPLITLLGATTQNLTCGTSFNDPGATANDLCEGVLSSSIVSAGTVDSTTPGTYTITYSLSDAEGNVATPKTRTVNVVDILAPVITLVGNSVQTVACSGVFTDLGATAFDTCEGVLTAGIVASGTVDTTTPGSYVRTYTLSDAAGNTAVRTRTVNVVDNIAPVLTLTGSASVLLGCGDIYVDAGATALDACAGNLSASIETTTNIQTGVPGVYTVAYDVSDSEGNAASRITRTVTVLDDCTEGEGEGSLTCEYTVRVNGCPDCQILVDGALTLGDNDFFLDDCDSTHCFTPLADPDGDYVFVGWDGVGRKSDELCTTDSTVTASFAAAEGEGEGEGQDEVQLCVAECSDDVDEDHDGVTACAEACFGSSDALIDSDEDGIPDNYEAQFYPYTNPSDATDKFAEPDADELTNFEEYVLGTNPGSAASPARMYFVAKPPLGIDQPNRGTVDRPWASISYALTQVAATQPLPARIVVGAGTYVEEIRLKPYIDIVSRRGNLVTIAGSVEGAEGAGLFDLTLEAAADDGVLLDMTNKRMRVAGVTFRGTTARLATGILADGPNQSNGVIENCLFTSLAIGIDIQGTLPSLRSSVFGNLSVTGIRVRCDDAGTKDDLKSFGDAGDTRSGFNTFLSSIDGPAVINECPEPLLLENNDWDLDAPTSELIADRLEGPVDFTPFLGKDGAILAGGLFVTVWDDSTQRRILNARVEIGPGTSSAVTVNTNGVYAFPALTDDLYDVTVTAEGFSDNETQAVVRGGELTGIVVPLTSVSAEGEGEGEGEGEAPGGCNCSQTNAKTGLPQSGDALLTGFTLLSLLLLGGLFRRS